MKEIGSEYWLDTETIDKSNLLPPSWLNIGADSKLLISGRTATFYILKDILKSSNVKTAYLPSYCCQSMIQPFIDLNIDITFYGVSFHKELEFDINVNEQCDIFFAMNYFGFKNGRMDEFIDGFKKRETIVIEDSTHSLLTSIPYNANADYVVASLRKSFPIISGGLAAKVTGHFSIEHNLSTNEEYVAIKRSAMVEKSKYLNDQKNNVKKAFLEKFRISNEMLSNNELLYNIDEVSLGILNKIDVKQVYKKKLQNAKYIYRNLDENQNFRYIFPEIYNGDCPIFIPIIFNNQVERNRLRKHLINNNMYFPVHWPIPEILKGKSTSRISDHELSIVIDQRYDIQDMKNIIRRISDFYE